MSNCKVISNIRPLNRVLEPCRILSKFIVLSIVTLGLSAFSYAAEIENESGTVSSMKFVVPNEGQPEKLYRFAIKKPGALISVGTLRTLYDVGTRPINRLIFLDYGKETVEFNRLHLAVLAESSTPWHYLANFFGVDMPEAIQQAKIGKISRAAFIEQLSSAPLSSHPSEAVAGLQTFLRNRGWGPGGAPLRDGFLDHFKWQLNRPALETKNHYWMNEQIFSNIRQLVLQGRAHVVAGSIAGDRTMKSIAAFLKERQETVAVVNFSNALEHVSDYLGESGRNQLSENLKALPLDPEGLVEVTVDLRRVDRVPTLHPSMGDVVPGQWAYVGIQAKDFFDNVVSKNAYSNTGLTAELEKLSAGGASTFSQYVPSLERITPFGKFAVAENGKIYDWTLSNGNILRFSLGYTEVNGKSYDRVETYSSDGKPLTRMNVSDVRGVPVSPEVEKLFPIQIGGKTVYGIPADPTSDEAVFVEHYSKGINGKTYFKYAHVEGREIQSKPISEFILRSLSSKDANANTRVPRLEEISAKRVSRAERVNPFGKFAVAENGKIYDWTLSNGNILRFCLGCTVAFGKSYDYVDTISSEGKLLSRHNMPDVRGVPVSPEVEKLFPMQIGGKTIYGIPSDPASDEVVFVEYFAGGKKVRPHLRRSNMEGGLLKTNPISESELKGFNRQPSRAQTCLRLLRNLF